jgi:uncharacterized surface protein with fasciclin (FAS1) repeats
MTFRRMRTCNPDLYEQIAGRPDFSTLTNLIDRAVLRNALSGTIGITIFAPTNDAIAKVPKKTLDDLMGSQEALSKFLRYHIIQETLPRHTLEPLKTRRIETLLKGRFLSVYRSETGDVEVNRFNQLVGNEIYGLNGLVQPIDGVLMPM